VNKAPDATTKAGKPEVSLQGAGMILIASAFVAASTLCAKQLGVGENAMSSFQVTWARYAFGFALLVLVAVAVKPKFTRPNWTLHMVRITCGVVGVLAMFYAVSKIPVADTTAITFLNPMFAMVFAIFILGERVGPIRWGTAALALFGGLLLIRPGSTSFQPEALLALAAAVLFGMEVVIIKLLAGREGAFQIILIANFFGAILASFALPFVWQMPVGDQWVWMAGTGILMVTAQAFYTKALRIGEASFVLPFAYATLVFAALYDFVLFDVVPVPLSMVGGAIIVISGIVLAWRENKARAKAD
jgi:drug/metabolite transporter (DMT)-like permease